jgi:hypothetical protein
LPSARPSDRRKKVLAAVRLAAIQPDKNPPPIELQLAWLAEKWGARAVYGPEPDLKDLARASHLLRVHDVFTRSKDTEARKRMSPEDLKLMLDILQISTEAD